MSEHPDRFTAGDVAELDFGEAVAENEVRIGQLRHNFVETPAFRQLAGGRADLVLGEKGSGKTALFHMLASRQTESDATLIVPAFRFRDSLHRLNALESIKQLGQDDYRQIWRTFILASAGNAAAEHGYASSDLQQYLAVLNLRGERDDESLFDNVIRLVRTPDGLDRERREEHSGTVSTDLDVIERALDDSLARHGIGVWIALDRLDEAFQDDRSTETYALRGLLQCMRDLHNSMQSVRAIAFLRPDLFTRLALSERFVNQTHFMTVRLAWERSEFIQLIVRRMEHSSGLIKKLGLHPHQLASNLGHNILVRNLLPDRDPQRLVPLHTNDQQDTLTWILNCTAHRWGEFNARNLIDFFKLARQIELTRRKREGDAPTAHLLSTSSLRRAHVQLSSQRLTDTVHGEWPETIPLTNRLTGCEVTFADDAALAHALGITTGSSDYQQALGALRATGIISRVPDRDHSYQVTPLFRPALRVRSVPDFDAPVVATPGTATEAVQPGARDGKGDHQRVFISYRRTDSEYVVGRVHDRLEDRLGKDSVFRYVDNMPVGENIRAVIEEALRDTAVVLAVIGPGWDALPDGDGGRMLADPDDFVRVELEAAYQIGRSVIPVLVKDATMPQKSSLPPSIRQIVDTAGMELRGDPHFDHDIERLARELERLTQK